ncbi:MAG: type 1 glutamine amidotransferase [bacterium]|nr:type 1 glutamine amidotransferase [bacterium]MDD5353951.1 type 1 glutamine amidotransferase [bacterium]MDD5756224.1 type 1 glutamine amidotransferase [bacterium]
MKKKILVVKHVENEGPGSIGDFFRNSAWELHTIDLFRGERLDLGLEQVAAVVVMGGPMNVYEEDKYPFLKEENVFIKKVVEQEIPYLGICLGSQLLAKACGAAVIKAPEKEVGWFNVSLTLEAAHDPLLQGVDGPLEVFQWHEDTFTIPDGGVLLATAETCRNQAFRCGKNAYGLQFHVEVSTDMIWSWVKADESLPDPVELLMGAYKRKEIMEQQAKKLYTNLSTLLKA